MSAAAASAQRGPFIAVSPRPTECLFPFQDTRGGLWLASCERDSGTLLYFDGTRYISPVQKGSFNGFVRGLAEDAEGGILLASSGGIYRFYRGSITKILDGVAAAGITEIAPDIFLTTIGKPGTDLLVNATAVRLTRDHEQWRSDVVIDSIPQVQFRLDSNANVLYGCAGGYCEFPMDAAVHWRPGSKLPVTHHELSMGTRYATEAAVVLRDKSGCVWLRNSTVAAYQCPEDAHAVSLSSTAVSAGYPLIFELEDGTIVLPGSLKMAIGRPGKFQVFTKDNGYSGSVVTLVLRDGSLWLGTGHVLPLRSRIEYWSLDENAGSITRVGNNVFSVIGHSIAILDASRSRWRTLVEFSGEGRLLAGPNGTLLAASDQGVVQLDMAGKVLRRSQRKDIKALIKDRDGQFWALGGTVFKVVFADNALRLDLAGFPGVVESGGNLKSDENGQLWVCGGWGLVYRDAAAWHTVPIARNLLEDGCGSLTEDRTGSIWYGYKVTPAFSLIQEPRSQAPVIHHFQSSDDVGKALSYFFDSDDRGRLWRGAPDGIYVADPEQAARGVWLRLDGENGLPKVGGEAFFADNDGSVWIKAENSIEHIHPSFDFVHPSFAPSVFISSFTLNGGVARAADTVHDIDNSSNIIAHIGSLQFDRRNAMRLRYRILPEGSWITAKDFDLHLGKLPWGNHTLQIQARLMMGPWSPVAEKSFAVKSPEWLTLPYLLVYAAGGSGFVFAVSAWRRRLMLERNVVLPDLSAWRMAALSPETEHLIGTIIDGRYEIGHILSVGGLATVARARESCGQGSLCAIKIFRFGFPDGEWVRHRFDQEVAALEQLSHPNIVKITAHGKIDTGAPYLVMEFIQGISLRDLLLEKGALSRQQVASFVSQLASALQALHQRSIYHRDLKPENFMIRSDADNAQQIVVIDFSIALVKSPDQTFHGISRVAGTLDYMAPEQLTGYADSSTDIHSLAKVVIEMLSGSRWSELMEWATLDMPGQVRGYFARNPHGLSQRSVEMLALALSFDPIRRPTDAALFAEPIIRDLEGAF